MENNNNGLPEYRVGNGSASGPEAAHAKEDIPNMEQNGYAYGQQAQNGGNYQQAGGQWVVTLIIGMIPCVGIILYIVWGFSSAGNENRKNFCKAQLLIIAVLFVLYILVAVILGFSAFSARTIYF